MNRSFKIVLTVSIVVNLLLAGVMIGLTERNFAEGPPHHMPPPPPSLSGLSPEKRAEFERTMDQVGKDTEELRDELHEAHKKLGDLVKADPFDKAAYLEQMQRIHELHGKLADHMAQAIANLAGEWGPQDRATLADAVRGPMMPPPPHGNGPHPGEGPPPPAPGDTPPPPPGDGPPPAN